METSVLNWLLLAQEAFNLCTCIQEKIDEKPYPEVRRYLRSFSKAWDRYERRRNIAYELMKGRKRK